MTLGVHEAAAAAVRPFRWHDSSGGADDEDAGWSFFFLSTRGALLLTNE